VQSSSPPHALPGPQPPHEPPQSTAVSVPFWTKSVHVGAWHVLALQTRVVQSPELWHPCPASQGLQVPPPQSTPVSLPLRMASPQLGA
jgi:hypothetical protein